MNAHEYEFADEDDTVDENAIENSAEMAAFVTLLRQHERAREEAETQRSTPEQPEGAPVTVASDDTKQTARNTTKQTDSTTIGTSWDHTTNKPSWSASSSDKTNGGARIITTINHDDNAETKETATKDKPSNPEKGCNPITNDNIVMLMKDDKMKDDEIKDDEIKDEEKKPPAILTHLENQDSPHYSDDNAHEESTDTRGRTTRRRNSIGNSGGGKRGYSTAGMVTRARSKERPLGKESTTAVGSTTAAASTSEVEPFTVVSSLESIAGSETGARNSTSTKPNELPPASKKRKVTPATTARRGPCTTTHKEETVSVMEYEGILELSSADFHGEANTKYESGTKLARWIKQGDKALEMIVYNSQEKTCFREKLTETEVKFHFTMADFAKNSTKSDWVPLTAAFGWWTNTSMIFNVKEQSVEKN